MIVLLALSGSISPVGFVPPKKHERRLHEDFRKSTKGWCIGPHPGFPTELKEPCGALPRKCLFIHSDVADVKIRLDAWFMPLIDAGIEGGDSLQECLRDVPKPPIVVHDAHQDEDRSVPAQSQRFRAGEVSNATALGGLLKAASDS
jgi:hypothetical protein